MLRRSMRRLRRRVIGAGTSALLIAAGACGNLTPGGIIVAEATVAVTGNVPTPAPAPPPPVSSLVAGSAPLPTSHDPEEADEADEAEGQVHVRFLVSLVSETGSEIQLGENEIEVEVDLQGADEPPVVTQLVPAVRYTQLRLVFTEIKAEVDPGSIINGQPVSGEVHVELQDLSLLVTRPIDLDVTDGRSVLLVVDLNAPAWLTALDPMTLTVDETVFADLINVVAP